MTAAISEPLLLKKYDLLTKPLKKCKPLTYRNLRVPKFLQLNKTLNFLDASKLSGVFQCVVRSEKPHEFIAFCSEQLESKGTDYYFYASQKHEKAEFFASSDELVETVEQDTFGLGVICYFGHFSAKDLNEYKHQVVCQIREGLNVLQHNGSMILKVRLKRLTLFYRLKSRSAASQQLYTSSCSLCFQKFVW